MKIFLNVTLLLIIVNIPFYPSLHSENQTSNSMNERILSKDFSTAQAALEENKHNKNLQAVCLSLKHRSLIIRKLAAQALGELKAKSSIQCLIEALEQNQTALIGGTETDIEQDKLNEAIIDATEKITGLELKNKKALSRKEIRIALGKIKRWQAAQKGKT